MGKTVVVSQDTWEAIRDFLADVEGMTIGEFIDEAVMYACESMEEPHDQSFEKYLDLDEEEEEEEGESETEETEEA